MHTDHTLKLFDAVTVRLGREFRGFVKNTCSDFETKELKRETAARKRRALKKATKMGITLDPATAEARKIKKDTSDAALLKVFNLFTYKYHSLGDHPDAIREFGTNDSHSTEPVCDLHQIYIQCSSIIERASLSIEHQRLDSLGQVESFSSSS